MNDWRLYLLATVVVATATCVARWRRPLRPVAGLLAYGLAADVLRRIIRTWVLCPWTTSHGELPLAGWTRVAGHASQWLLLGWGAGVALVAAHLFRPAGRRWVVAAWSVVGVGAAVAYPWLRQDRLGVLYMAWTVAVVVASGWMVTCFLLRRGRPSVQHVAVVWVVAVEASLLLGPYLFGPFSTWWTAKLAYAVMYVGLLPTLTWGTLWKLRS